MAQQKITNSVAEFIKNKFITESSGHDWWHIYRVWQTSLQIASLEGGDLFIIELAALLHDIADWKFHDGDEKIGGIEAEKLLRRFSLPSEKIKAVVEIVNTISFKGANTDTNMSSLEGKIVQDADRLDAIGAIGIARTFAYGGNNNRVLYDPNIAPTTHSSFDAYKNSKGPTINHFYEKLLLLKDRMQTQTGRKMAVDRHRFMEEYLQQFFTEWEGKA